MAGLPAGVEHRDFTGGSDAVTDGYGHGTHVAGIVAGRTAATAIPIAKVVEIRDQTDTVHTVVMEMPADTVLRGVAPKAKIGSLKVLDERDFAYFREESGTSMAAPHVAGLWRPCSPSAASSSAGPKQ